MAVASPRSKQHSGKLYPSLESLKSAAGAGSGAETGTSGGSSEDAALISKAVALCHHCPPSQLPVSQLQWAFLALACAQVFSCFLTTSMLAPFFPAVALDVGASMTETNVIYGAMFFTMCVTSPLNTRLLVALGPRPLYLGGTYLRILADMSFGLLIYINDKAKFVTTAVALRVVSGAGEVALTTAAYSMAAKEFPERTGLSTGCIQASLATGIMLGPPIGGLLYHISHDVSDRIEPYTFPFLCVAAFGFVITTINAIFLTSAGGQFGRQEDYRDVQYVLPKAEQQQRGDKCHRCAMVVSGGGSGERLREMWRLMRTSAILTNMMWVMFSFGLMFYIDITLSAHLHDRFDFRPDTVGLIFSIVPASYALGSAVFGIISDRAFYPNWHKLMAGLCMAAGCFLIGPCPVCRELIGLRIWPVYVSLVLIGLATSAINITSYKDILLHTLALGLPHSYFTNSIVSSLFVLCISLGGFGAPIFGGLLIDYYGFPWATTVFGVLATVAVIVFALKLVCCRQQ